MANMMALPSRIFLSPHADDIAYSCYGSIVNPPVPKLEGCLILTVFGVSGTAAALQGERRSQQEITKIRKQEDQRFAQSEGCRLVSLDFEDSGVRGEPIEGPVSAHDDCTKHPLYQTVKTAIAEIILPAVGQASIYVPLGIRGHIDHRMVRDAAKDIAQESHIPGALSSLIFYEDLPYAAFEAEHQIRQLAKCCVSPTARPYEVSLRGLWFRKKKAMMIYGSQITPFIVKNLTDYASSLGTSQVPDAERLWVAEPSAVRPDVDIMAWVTWEAARRVGGYTTLFNHIFQSPKFQTIIGRTVLMGPMYMPLVCPEYDPLEDIQSIASTLDCHILYPPLVASNPVGLSKRTSAMFKDIENRHGIAMFYLRDKGGDHSHPVDRCLFNFSMALDHENVYMPSLPQLLQDLKHEINLSVDINVKRHSPTTQALSAIRDWTGFAPKDNRFENVWNKSRCDTDASYYAHKDSDSVYGLLLALPVAECLRVITEPDETAVLVATDELSLPAVYATQIARQRYSASYGPTIKTLFYSGDVHPIRNLTTGAVSPHVPSLESFSGFDFEGPIRSLIDLSLNRAITSNGGSGSAPHLLSFAPLRHIATHTNMRIMQHAWRADAVAATSASTRDELLFLDAAFTRRGEISIVSPGVSIIPCQPDEKERCRRRLVHYARTSWGFDDLVADSTIIATQIGRAVAPKAFLRTVRLLQSFSSTLSASGMGGIKILLVIVTSWDDRRVRVGDYRMIDELLRELGGTSYSSANLRVKVVNQPRWPISPEATSRPTGMTREDLHRATDISVCLSLYDTFAIAPLEPMGCGAIVVVSTGCGSFRKILELENWEENVIIADYAEDWVASLLKQEPCMGSVLDAHFDITYETKAELEKSTHRKVSSKLTDLLPRTAAERAQKLDSGRRLATRLNWEDQFGVPFQSLMRSLFEMRDE